MLIIEEYLEEGSSIIDTALDDCPSAKRERVTVQVLMDDDVLPRDDHHTLLGRRQKCDKTPQKRCAVRVHARKP